MSSDHVPSYVTARCSKLRNIHELPLSQRAPEAQASILAAQAARAQQQSNAQPEVQRRITRRQSPDSSDAESNATDDSHESDITDNPQESDVTDSSYESNSTEESLVGDFVKLVDHGVRAAHRALSIQRLRNTYNAASAWVADTTGISKQSVDEAAFQLHVFLLTLWRIISRTIWFLPTLLFGLIGLLPTLLCGLIGLLWTYLKESTLASAEIIGLLWQILLQVLMPIFGRSLVEISLFLFDTFWVILRLLRTNKKRIFLCLLALATLRKTHRHFRAGIDGMSNYVCNDAELSHRHETIAVVCERPSVTEALKREDQRLAAVVDPTREAYNAMKAMPSYDTIPTGPSDALFLEMTGLLSTVKADSPYLPQGIEGKAETMSRLATDYREAVKDFRGHYSVRESEFRFRLKPAFRDAKRLQPHTALQRFFSEFFASFWPQVFFAPTEPYLILQRYANVWTDKFSDETSLAYTALIYQPQRAADQLRQMQDLFAVVGDALLHLADEREAKGDAREAISPRNTAKLVAAALENAKVGQKAVSLAHVTQWAAWTAFRASADEVKKLLKDSHSSDERLGSSARSVVRRFVAEFSAGAGEESPGSLVGNTPSIRTVTFPRFNMDCDDDGCVDRNFNDPERQRQWRKGGATATALVNEEGVTISAW